MCQWPVKDKSIRLIWLGGSLVPRSWKNLKVNQFNCFCLYGHQNGYLLKFINIIYWEVDLECGFPVHYIYLC